jgi:hypothetical protein
MRGATIMNIYEYIVDRRMCGNPYVLDELATFLSPCRKPEKVLPRLDVWCDIHGVEVNDLQRKTIVEYLFGTVNPRVISYSFKPQEMPFDMIETLLLVEWKYI